MFLSSSSKVLLGLLLIIVQSLADTNFPLSDDEKVFTSIVSLNAIGNPLAALNEKTILEQSFQIAYNKLLHFPICSFRSLEDIALVNIMRENDEFIDDTTATEDSKFFLHFEMTIRCFDCFNENGQLFHDDDENRTSSRGRKLQEVGRDTCNWSNYLLDDTSFMEDLDGKNVAPSRSDFVEEFNKVIAEQQEVVAIEEVLAVVDERTVLMTAEPLSCPCPKNSFCSYTNIGIDDFWEISGKGIFHNCTCRDGFIGEGGWRCEMINECKDEDNWPCAPPDEGGYCVNTHPDNTEHPMYKCGCRSGFKADESYPQDDVHGIKHCLSENENREDESSKSDIANITSSITCSTENLFPGIISLNVTGNPDTILNDKEKLEQSIKAAYEKSLSSQCAFRSLESVALLGVLRENGEFVDIPSNTTTARYLEEEIEDTTAVAAGLELNNGTNSSAELGETELYLDDSGLDFNFNFNFSIFFSLIMRCFGCPDDARLFNDASRRGLLRGQRILEQEEGACFCELDDGSIEDLAEVANIAPSIDDFVEEFNEVIIEQEVISIKEAVTIEDKTDSSPPFINPPAEEERTNNVCGNGCNARTQECIQGTCLCKAGFFAPSGQGGACKDLPECRNGQHRCDRNANCIELEGTYDCSCKEGYDGDGFSCSDIDECQLKLDDCGNTAFDVCINLRGSFTCVARTLAPTRKPAPIPNPIPDSTSNPTQIPTPDPTPDLIPSPTPVPTCTNPSY